MMGSILDDQVEMYILNNSNCIYAKTKAQGAFGFATLIVNYGHVAKNVASCLGLFCLLVNIILIKNETKMKTHF